MAIYRLSAQIVKRSDGRSATAAAAYRAGGVVPDERTGLVFDYTRRRGVLHAEILTPPGTAQALHDRTALWNAVETFERRRDAQVARELELALPHELTPAERLELVRAFVQQEFVALGMIADVAMHRPDRRGDPRNHHAHVMLTLRPIAGDAFGPKARDWNDTALLEHWRKAWAAAVNTALANRGLEARVDHRSYVDCDLAIEPETKMGPVATAMERRGRSSHAGDDRRAVRARNKQRVAAAAKLARINAELEAMDEARQAREDDAGQTQGQLTLPPHFSPTPEIPTLRPPLRGTRRKHAASWTIYLYKMWATVARAVTTPFQSIASAMTRRKPPDLRR